MALVFLVFTLRGVLRLSNIFGPKKFMRKSELKNFIYHKNPKIKYIKKTSKYKNTIKKP